MQGVRCEETYRAPVPELGVPEPGVPGSVTLGPVPGLLLMPEPVLPVLGVPGSVTLGPVPGLLLMPEPLLPVPGVPEPLIPEPLLPVPLLPEPEVWASTNGAVTRSTARAVTTVLLILLNITFFSYNLYGCALWFLASSRVPLRSPQRGTRAYQGKEQLLCHGYAQASTPLAVPSWGIALSYFENRHRQRLVQEHDLQAFIKTSILRISTSG
jgi:hypothetical protein